LMTSSFVTCTNTNRGARVYSKMGHMYVAVYADVRTRPKKDFVMDRSELKRLRHEATCA
jgi:hypothetical protein